MDIDLQLIKEKIHKFFKEEFLEKCVRRPKFISNDFKTLSYINADPLIVPLSSSEIKDVVWGCGGEKAPGPNGFSFKFIKNF